MIPVDITTFARGVVAEIRTALGHDATPDPQERLSPEVRALGELAVWYVQVREAVGRPPTLGEVGTLRFKRVGTGLGPNLEQAWERYGRIVERLLVRYPQRTKRQQ